jgi:hypothetical protein
MRHYLRHLSNPNRPSTGPTLFATALLVQNFHRWWAWADTPYSRTGILATASRDQNDRSDRGSQGFGIGSHQSILVRMRRQGSAKLDVAEQCNSNIELCGTRTSQLPPVHLHFMCGRSLGFIVRAVHRVGSVWKDLLTCEEPMTISLRGRGRR